MTLLKYKQDLSADSKPVELFSPGNSENAYFSEIGWLSNITGSTLPNNDTLWVADNKELTPTQPVNLRWVSPEGLKFLVTISMDDNYLFTLKQSITNNSNKPLSIQYYGIINRNYNSKEKLVNILHQGPIGTISEQLKESTYDDIKDKKI